MKLSCKYNQTSNTLTLYFPEEFDTTTLADASVTAAKIADESVGDAKIDRTTDPIEVITGDLKDALITTAKLANLAVDNSKLAELTIEAGKLNIGSPYLSGDTWTDDSPGAGSIAWNEHTLVYNGTAYTINSGDTSDTYVYFDGTTTYATSNSVPTLTNSQFNIATNNSGAADLAWMGVCRIPTAVIGTAAIADAAIATAKIADAAVVSAKIGNAEIGTAHIGTVTLDSLTDNTYGKVQAGVLDGGYLYLLRKSADANEKIEVTASGIEQYTNNVKMIELASGNLYLGDQSNEHVKISSSGMDVKDGATVLANYGSTTTIGQVAAFQNNIKIDSGAMYFRNNTTNIISITAAGIPTINMPSGGDIILNGDDSTPAKLTIGGTSYDILISGNTSGTVCNFEPDTASIASLRFGNNYRFNTIDFYTTSYTQIRSTDGTNYVSIVVREDANACIRLNSYFGSTTRDIVMYIDTSGGNYRFAPDSAHKVFDLGRSSDAWDDVYADDFNNVADFYFLDDRDDIQALTNIQGSGIIDERTGLELINDDTLEDWMLVKYKNDIFDEDANLIAKKGDIARDPDGKPYISTKMWDSLLRGAIVQLNNKHEQHLKDYH